MQLVEAAGVSGPFALRRSFLSAADVKSPDTARARAWIAEGPGLPKNVTGDFRALPVARAVILAVVYRQPRV